MLIYSVFVGFLLILDSVKSANILALFPYQGISHFHTFKGLLKELSKKGHNVDVLSHFPLETPLPRYRDISVKGTLPSLLSTVDVDIAVPKNLLQDLNVIFEMCGEVICKAVFDTSQVQELKNTKKKYDLIITEIFFMDCFLGFAHHFQAPVIGFTSSVNLPWTSERIGLPDNPSYIPNYFTSYSADMSFTERLYNAAALLLTKYWYETTSISMSDRYSKEFFGPDTPHIRDIFNNVSLVLVNSHLSLHQSRPVPANFIEVGGIHIEDNPVLPKHFEEILKTDLKGIIYLSFGSLFKTESFSEPKLRALFEAFGELPYKVLWKGDRSKFSKRLQIPSNIHFEPWMPQLALLCHPNVKLFISHGGLLGTQEGVHCGVPILGMPLWVDQLMNIKTVARKGLGLGVPFSELTKGKVENAARTLLEDPKYKRKAEETSKLFRDRPMSPMETAVYWSEYVIRYKGAPHLRSKGADLAWYQYYCLDLLAVPIGILGLICIIFIQLFKLFRKPSADEKFKKQ